MGTFKVDARTKPGVLICSFEGSFSEEEVVAFVARHNAAVRSFGSAEYRVLVDLREMLPLSPEAAAVIGTSQNVLALRDPTSGAKLCW